MHPSGSRGLSLGKPVLECAALNLFLKDGTLLPETGAIRAPCCNTGVLHCHYLVFWTLLPLQSHEKGDKRDKCIGNNVVTIVIGVVLKRKPLN